MAIAGSANSITVLDLITEVLTLYGQYVPGETIAAADSQSLLFTLNGILDGLGAEKLGMFASTSANFTIGVVQGKVNYTLGPIVPGSTADWTLNLSPESLYAVSSFSDANTERPLRILTDQDWARLQVKYVKAALVDAVYIQTASTFQMVTLSFYPLPSQPVGVILYFRQPIQLLAATSNTLFLPFGYQELLTYELAIKASPKFGANLPPWIYPAWQSAKTRVKEASFQAADSRVDHALAVYGRGWGWGRSWDINRGE